MITSKGEQTYVTVTLRDVTIQFASGKLVEHTLEPEDILIIDPNTGDVGVTEGNGTKSIFYAKHFEAFCIRERKHRRVVGPEGEPLKLRQDYVEPKEG